MRKPKIVMVFGTFDLIHPGHLYFLRAAKKQGQKLVVSIARDINVKKIKKRAPMFSELRRASAIKKTKIADQIVLGGKTDYISHILKMAPDIICLGYDQYAYTKNLRRDLKKAGLKTKIIRLKSFKPHIYKSSKLKQNLLQ